MVPAHPRRVVGLLVAATCIPLGVLGWLGQRTVQQDRQLEAARQLDTIRLRGAGLAIDLARQLQDVEGELAGGRGIRLLEDGPQSVPEASLLYRRPPGSGNLWFPPSLPDAEAAEFGSRDLGTAAAAYRLASISSDPALRAAALLGLGRVLRRVHDWQGALAAYEDLAGLDDVPVAGAPAALVARHARGLVLEESGDTAALEQDTDEFARVVARGGWDIDRPTYIEYRDAIRRWGGSVPTEVDEARAAAALDLWLKWRAGELGTRGRLVLPSPAGPVLAVWAQVPPRLWPGWPRPGISRSAGVRWQRRKGFDWPS